VPMKPQLFTLHGAAVELGITERALSARLRAVPPDGRIGRHDAYFLRTILAAERPIAARNGGRNARRAPAVSQLGNERRTIGNTAKVHVRERFEREQFGLVHGVKLIVRRSNKRGVGARMLFDRVEHGIAGNPFDNRHDDPSVDRNVAAAGVRDAKLIRSDKTEPCCGRVRLPALRRRGRQRPPVGQIESRHFICFRFSS